MDLTSYIASMSVSMAQANVAQSVSTAMLSKSIDSIEQSGAEVVDLINSADIPPAMWQTPSGLPRCSSRQGWPGRTPVPDGR